MTAVATHDAGRDVRAKTDAGNGSTLGEVVRFEVSYRLRQPSTWVYAFVLFAIPFLMMHAVNGSRQLLNAPQSVMFASTVLGGIGMLVSAGIFGDAAARDVATRMHSLFFTSPLRERHYIIGRFIGAVAVNAVLLLGIPLGLLLASVMPYMEPGKFGPVQIASYVQAYAMILLPNLVLVGTCMFAAAALTRSSMATYAGGIALFVLGIVAKELTNALRNPTLTALLDPFGAEAVQVVTRYWTPSEANERLIGWASIILLNRALWLAIALGVLGLVVARFRFTHPVRLAGRRWWQRRAVVDTAPEQIVALDSADVGSATRSFAFADRVRQTVAVAARAWREIALTKAFLVLLAGALLFVFAAGWDVGTERYGTSSWPVTHLIAGTVLSSFLAPVMALLVAVFAGELVWRERDAGMGDIAGVAPIPNWVALFGRFAALVAMLAVLQLVFALAGMLLQTMQGYHRYEPRVYLELLFGVKLVDYVILAALAMAVHVIVNNKYIGHLVVVVYFVSTMLAGLIGLRHRLLVFGSTPGWVWSDFNGLGPFLQGLVWLKLYWAAWALLFAVVANLFWVRGRELGARRRLALARQRLHGPALRVLAFAVTLIVTLGGFVFYNTNVLHEYRSPDEQAARAADYERRYKRFENVPKPSLTAARTTVELYPHERAATIRGTFRFVNGTAARIDSLHVMLNPDVVTRTLKFDRPSVLVSDDSVMNYRIYALAQPLLPGDSIAMDVDEEFRPRGFENAGAPTEVTENGTYFEGVWLPRFGYQRGRELEDEVKRHALGLPPRQGRPSAGDVEARESGARTFEMTNVETTIGTDSDQIAITPGTLVREWRENGRRYFQYKTDQPIRYAGTILSAKYAVREDKWNDIPLRIFYHPTHDVNVGRLMQGMKSALAYYSQQFGPFQFHELSIVESPLYQSGARAHPHTIVYSEGSAFITRVDSGDLDRTFFVAAHETAHQWWGGQVIPTAAKGASMVSETLAQYSSMMVLETEYGRDMAKRFYDYNLDEYLRGRTVFTNREAPLLEVDGQQYVHYFKGAVAMYTLRDRLGVDVVNGALRRFREKYSGVNAPPATSHALYAELQAVTPDPLKPLLSDLFEHITLWDVKTDSVRAEPDGAGAWRTTLYVDAAKARADSTGRQTPIPMDDLVEIGVFGDAAAGQGLGETLYLQQQRIHTGKQTITVVVPKRPVSAGVDPYRKFIERERDDNVKGVTPRTLD